MSIKDNLIRLIDKKKAKVGVIGLGYVGLPLVKHLCNSSFKVIGFDDDKRKIGTLNQKKSYISSLNSSEIKKILNKKFFLSSSYKDIGKVDIIILCLPTPLTKSNNPNLIYIKKALHSIKKFLKAGQLIVLESSTYPGCTNELIVPLLKRKKFEIGKDFFVGYSPEREDPSNKKFSIRNIPKICSGVTKNCSIVTQKIYSKIANKIVTVSNIETAEFTKIFENLYRSVNIALVNEMKTICRKLGLDIHEIISAAKTKPFGYEAFYPGPGVGGHCIPIDPFYLSWLAKKNKINLKFIELSGKINDFISKWIISNSLKNNFNKILLVGAAYKKNVDDPRESPIFNFKDKLSKKKIKIDYHDPHVQKLESRKLKKVFYSKKINSTMLRKYDLIYIITDHDKINFDYIQKHGKRIIDTRNVYKNKKYKNVIKL